MALCTLHVSNAWKLHFKIVLLLLFQRFAATIDLRLFDLRRRLAHLVHIERATKEEFMKYVVKYSTEGARQLAELRAARRELNAARRAMKAA